MFECTYCGQKFPSPQQLGRHRPLCRQWNKWVGVDITTPRAVRLRRNVSRESPLHLGNAASTGFPVTRPSQAPTGVPKISMQHHTPSVLPTEIISSELSHSNLVLGEVVRGFYLQFEDLTFPLWPKAKHRVQVGEKGMALINFCLSKRMSAGSTKDVYDLQRTLQNISGHHPYSSKSKHWLDDDFRGPEHFNTMVMAERRFVVCNQGWREAQIHTALGCMDKGVFRPVGRFLRGEIFKAGGVSRLTRPSASLDEYGVRRYSCLLNSDALVDDYYALKNSKPFCFPVFFTLYGDKTMLARSGAQDGMVLRCRIDNLKGFEDTWHDIAYAPLLTHGAQHTEQAIRDARLSLFHRFLFLVLQDISEPACYGRYSLEGEDHSGEIDVNLQPRLTCIIADHPQEREFLCLKRGLSYQDCSQCTHRSLEQRNFNKRRRLCHSKVCETARTNCVPGERVGHSVTQILDRRLSVPPENCNVTAANYRSRNPVKTVALQCLVALLELLGKAKPSEDCSKLRRLLTATQALGVGLNLTLAQGRKELSKQSALRLPSALCVIDGLVSTPKRLFQVCGIDFLHTFDLGVSRMICDDAFKVFMRREFNNGRSKAAIVRLANCRIAGLPPDSAVQSFVPFRTVEGDKQATFTGKHRRQLLPFIWYALLGLNGAKQPDDDNLFLCALRLDWIQSTISSRKVLGCGRSENDIVKLQEEITNTCDSLMECFESEETTKVHRLRVHLSDHLLRFGSIEALNSDVNESLHKKFKACYGATNKKPDSVTKQLLQINAAAETRQEDLKSLQDGLKPSSMMAQSDTFGVQQSDYRMEHSSGDTYGDNSAKEAETFIIKYVNEVKLPYYYKDCVQTLCSQMDMYDCYLYERKFCGVLNALIEWPRKSTRNRRQIIYAGGEYRVWKDRHDAVIYDSGDGNISYAFIEAILHRKVTMSSTNIGESKLAILKKLECTPAVRGNRRIVDDFGFKRLQYAKVKGDVELTAVPWYRIKRKCVIVVDLWDLTSRHSFWTLPEKIPDSKAERMLSRFFIVNNFDHASIGTVQ